MTIERDFLEGVIKLVDQYVEDVGKKYIWDKIQCWVFAMMSLAHISHYILTKHGEALGKDGE